MTVPSPLYASPCGEIHPCRSVIRHWQLRDLVCRGPGPSEVFTIAGDRIVRYSVKTSTSETAMPLSFNANCVAYGFGFLATGGQSAEVRAVAPCGPCGPPAAPEAPAAPWSHSLAARACHLNPAPLCPVQLEVITYPTSQLRSRGGF
jgi:hypothetical protein